MQPMRIGWPGGKGLPMRPSVGSTIAAIALLIVVSLATPAVAQTDTTFTYQGELRHAGAPINGAADFRFTLRSSGGGAIGLPQTVTNVPVVDGRFSVELDFGANAFNLFLASPRVLQIDVRAPAGVGGYTTLTPHQPITRTPYAIQTRGLYADDDLNVGIGTVVPHAPLHVREGQAGSNGHANSSAIFERSGQNFVSILSPDASERGILFGDETSVASGGIVFNNSALPGGLQLRTGGNVSRMFLRSDGRVGIGTPSAVGQLTVADHGAAFGIDAYSSDDSLPTVLAVNSGNGPGLWVQGTSDASAAGGGLIVAGAETGHNVAIDRNEIMARDGGQPSTLYINADGGNILMGSQRTSPAFAYGKIFADGTFLGSPNISGVTLIGTNQYRVSFAGGLAVNDIIIASASFGSGLFALATAVDNGQMAIYCYNVVSDEYVRTDVNFVVFKP